MSDLKIETIKQTIGILKELENIERELNIKCKKSSDYIDTLKYLLMESNKNLNKIILIYNGI